jgi:hypothetical protein
MNDPLDDMIRINPRNEASPAFTPRVMARIRATSREPRKAAWRPALAAAVLAVVALLSGVAFEKQRDARRVDALRAEARQIEAEIEALKQLTAKSSEVYLGGNGNSEYVLDLRDLTAPSPEFRTVSQSY